MQSWPQGWECLNSDQQNILVMVAKDLNPHLYPTDPLFGNRDHYAFYIPLFRRYLEILASHTGNLASGYRLLVFPLNLIFLWGAYIFFCRLWPSRSLAAGLALCASFPFAVPGGAEMSGVGPLSQMLPRTLFTSVLPWLLMGYYRFLNHPRKLTAIFFATGLAANLHPVSGLLLSQILLLGLLFRRSFSWETWKSVLLGGLAACAGAAPTLWSYLVHQSSASLAAIPPDLLRDILQWRFPHNLYPPLNLTSLPPGGAHLLTAIVLVICVAALLTRRKSLRPAALWAAMLLVLGYLLYPEGRFYLAFLLTAVILFARDLPVDPDFDTTAGLVCATFLVAIGGALILQHSGLWQVFPGLAINQTRAARFVPFFLFIAVGFAVSTLLPLRGRPWSKSLVAALLLLAVGAQLRLTYRTHIHSRPQPARENLVDLAHWARNHTAPTDVFVFDSLAFRLLAQRSLTGCAKDGGLWFFASQGLVSWYDRQQQLADAQGAPLRLRELGRKWGARYIVISKAATNPSLPVAYANPGFYILRSE